LPESLIESELFGYEKGAFTGANSSKKGKFELAQGGTIFLDEIGTMPLNLQAKLLNVLQEKTIDRVGGTNRIPYDARIIAATNENLEKCVENKTFRQDLYYRLNVVRIEVPPLRYRKDDIIKLAKIFIERFNQEMNKRIRGAEENFLEYLQCYEWPGNVRELENVIESAIALCDNERLTSKDLPVRICKNNHNNNISVENDVKISLKEQEYLAIMAALDRFDGHREKTAQFLGISRRSLQYKLKSYNLIKDRDN
jgi:transcriptional regulator with PAS, ATPase and Fis domain